jgi:DNA repair protein RadA/Sms
LVNGSVLLIGGDPGVGKSTLVTQLCSKFKKSYYLSGEESFEQIYMRYKRVSEGDSEIKVMSSSYIDNAIVFLKKEIEEHHDETVVIVDSIQTMRTTEINSLPGGAVQIRECTSKLVEFAKTNNVPVIIIAHITKSGQIAGPKLVEHLVDVVLYFEGNNDTDLRILRSVKNRFGPTNEIGVFEMKEKGLYQVLDPSERFYDAESNLSGNSLGVIIEGNTPLVVEVQGLVVNAQFSTPRRLSKGIKPERLALISAVLTKRLNIQVEKNDIFINLLGGMKTVDPGIDFSIALSLYSSFTDRIFPKATASFGEIGLDGKIRSVSFPEKRITELKRLGFTRVLVPSKTIKRLSEKTIEGIDIIEYTTLQEALLKSFK